MASKPLTHEIRIHGVHNTPPHNMLNVKVDQVAEEPAAGDLDAGFWAPKARAGMPDGIATREAYSWGNLTSDPSAKGWRTAGARAAWLLLLPFALVNVGYWTRRVHRPGEPGMRGGVGAALYRFAGLLLTALYVTTATEIGVALVTWQCYGPGGQCSGLPSFLDALAGKPAGWRIAAGMLLPGLVLLVLWFVSRKSLQLYEDVPDHPPATTTGLHLLERSRFWSGKDRVFRLQRLHLAFGLGVLVAVTGWAGRWVAGLPDVSSATQRWHTLVFGLALALLAAVAVTAVFQAGDAPEYGGVARAAKLPSYLLRAGGALAAAEVYLLFRLPDVKAVGDLPGAGAVPVVLVIALVATVLFALTLNTPWHWLTVAAFAATVVVGCLAGAHHWTCGWAFVPAVATVVVGWVVHNLFRSRGDNGWRGWGGDSPAMLLGLGLLVALIYATAATLFVADRLNGGARIWKVDTTTATGHVVSPEGATHPPATAPVISESPPAASVLPAQCTAGTYSTDRLEVTCTPGTTPRRLALPLFWFWMAPALFLAMVGWLPVAVVSFVRRRKVDPASVRSDYFAPGAPGPTPAEEHQLDAVTRRRRMARYSHRAERVAGLCGPATALFVLLAVAGALTRQEAKSYHVGAVRVGDGLVAVGLYALSLVALGIVGLGAKMYQDGKARVSVAIVWDLTSFWPRAAHPFGPPCYAERAVPDLAYRVRYRLASGDRVVLSAHSLGAVIAVAAYFRIEPADRGRLALLTYGTQLRAYFGRLFPEVLGPPVLGHGPLGQARMSGASATLPAAPGPDSLAGELGVPSGKGRWLSLFRRTDYLGFAVYDEPDNAVDRHTLETKIPWTAGNPKPEKIESHGDYPKTAEYETALAELLTRW